MSEQGVYAALAAAQADYPAIAKTRTATVSSEKDGKWTKYTYNYADLADIFSAVRPVLAKHQLAVTQPIEVDERGHLVLRTSIVHADGSAIHSMLPLPAPTAKPQVFGSTLTFMRRYALSSLIGIATEEDDDGTAAQDPGPTERTSRPAATRPPAPPRPRPVESPEQAVTRATAEADAKDPWKLSAANPDAVVDLMLIAIDSRDWPEVERAMAGYRSFVRDGLTAEQRKVVTDAYVARRELVRADNLVMAG